jgi:DNA repair protein RadC
VKDSPRVPASYPVTSLSRIKDAPSRQQPRELFDRLGAEHVSDDVLIALLLRSGTRNLNVADLAKYMLSEYGSLTELSKASVDELIERAPGIGRVKAQIVKAALELAKRLAEEKTQSLPVVRTPDEAAAVLREQMRSREEESFWILMLDTKNGLRRPPREVSRGILDASLVHPREVFKEAIRCNSAAIILAHNHPSGDPTPSTEDIQITKKLVEAGELIEIAVLDHIILGRSHHQRDPDFVSLRETGLVTF